MKRSAILNASMLFSALAVGAGCSGGTQAAKGKGMAAEAKLKACEAKSATLNLVDEALLTRAAITPETIDSIAPPVKIAADDPRLSKLTTLLHGLKLEPAKLPQFELKLSLKVACADGSMLTVHGSPTGPDGRIDLSVDGSPFSTHQPLRKELEALAK